MPTIPTYIRQEDYPLYLSIKESDKGAWAEFIHNALNIPQAVKPNADLQSLKRKAVLRDPEEPLQVINMGTGKVVDADTEEEDECSNLVWDEAVRTVWNTETGEAVEATPEMVKKLKSK